MTNPKFRLNTLVSVLLALGSMVLLTAFANSHHGREPILHFWSHFAGLPGLALLIYSARNVWPAPKNRAQTFSRRILVLGISAGFVASTIGALSALPYALNGNLKEISLISAIHHSDQPLLALGFLATILGGVLTLLFGIWFRLRPQPAS